MAGDEGLSDDDIARWTYEDSEVEREFSEGNEHEETLPVCSDISSSESESSEEEESDDNMQPVTRSWNVYRDGDCNLIKFPYYVTQRGIHPSSKCFAAYYAAKHRTHTRSRALLATYPYTTRLAATEPE